jgi:hypothetical protein
MNDTAIKNYAVWAHQKLVEEVEKKCSYWGIYEENSLPANTDIIDGRVISTKEMDQRRQLLQTAKNDGYEQLIEKTAYTWFNRLLAIRFMEVNDRLPSHIRLLSSTEGTFEPQALKDAFEMSSVLEALDHEQVLNLVQSGNDEALFKAIFLAQCDQLAQYMPAVFEHVGSAMELLLPDGLLRQGGVVEQLVTTIPEDDWREGVEIVGWMYQYYVSERKEAVFASFKKGKKAERDAIAPATQLFTPNWIVRYLTENSLGRLWVLNHPESDLPKEMPYFVQPDKDAEADFEHISSPEDISVVDPACGSGHILVYAFELLSKIYAEAGYTNRDAARLIVEKNLHGFEIDPRAAAMASFAVTMKACELDSRFLHRGVQPQITALTRVEFTDDEVEHIPTLQNDAKLRDALAHLDECGSLLAPTQEQIDSLARDLTTLAGANNIFAATAAEKLQQAITKLTPLSKHYSIVAANPPYMGSKNMDKWLSAWIKKNYSDAYRDLCTSFIDRGFTLSCNKGFTAMVTMQSWMFLGSFEKLRRKILDNFSISSMAHLGTRAFGAIGGEVVSTTATVFKNAKEAVEGIFFRLVDMDSEAEKQAGLLEALANPNCGWFYRQSCLSFSSLPGLPIAYWVEQPVLNAFNVAKPMKSIAKTSKGLITGNNDEFFRLWWEISFKKIGLNIESNEQSLESGLEWFPLNKGGKFRKWYGNNEYVIHWANDGNNVHDHAKRTGHHSQDYDSNLKFKPNISWSDISSGLPNFRYRHNELSDHKGMPLFPLEISPQYCLGFLNSSVCAHFLSFLSPTLSCNIGEIEKLPVYEPNDSELKSIELLVSKMVSITNNDWNAFETSRDFKGHPLL